MTVFVLESSLYNLNEIPTNQDFTQLVSHRECAPHLVRNGSCQHHRHDLSSRKSTTRALKNSVPNKPWYGAAETRRVSHGDIISPAQ